MSFVGCGKLEPRTKHIPIVIVSADATPNQVSRLLDIGANEYLTKPLDLRRFLDVTRKLLHQVES